MRRFGSNWEVPETPAIDKTFREEDGLQPL
jgi:hypothetical protein